MPVLTLKGKPIDWASPPHQTDLVLWSRTTSGGKPVKGSLRTIAHLDHLDALSRAKYGVGIVVLQAPYNSTVAASAGTHDYDACLDLYIPGVSWDEQERFFRANGFAAWHRKPPAFGHHIHGFTLPPAKSNITVSERFAALGVRVGVYVDGGASLGKGGYSSQIKDYYQRLTGLAGHAFEGDRWHPAADVKGGVDATIFNFNAYAERQRRETEVLRLKIGWIGMNFSDTDKQREADFRTVLSRGLDVVMGSETGPGAGDSVAILKRVAKARGYRVVVTHRYNTWVAVKKTVVKGKWRKTVVHALDRSSMWKKPKPPGKWGDRAVVGVQFNLGKRYGLSAFGAFHSLSIKGSGVHKDTADLYMRYAIREWRARVGIGSDISFIAGDMNRDDKKFDASPLYLSCWDEREKWPGTLGARPIDIIARGRHDARVECKEARVFNDKTVFLHTDHKLIEAVYEIAPLNKENMK